MLMEGRTSLRDDNRLQLLTQHDHKALPTLYAVITVVESVLPPDVPTPCFIAAHRNALHVHGLIQQLEIVALAGAIHRLYSQFAHAYRRQKVQAQRAEHKH